MSTAGRSGAKIPAIPHKLIAPAKLISIKFLLSLLYKRLLEASVTIFSTLALDLK
jgi:hypothetical protein